MAYSVAEQIRHRRIASVVGGGEMETNSVEYEPFRMPVVPFVEPPAELPHTTSRAKWIALALTFSLLLAVVLIVALGPSAGAAGGCGGG